MAFCLTTAHPLPTEWLTHVWLGTIDVNVSIPRPPEPDKTILRDN